MLSRNNPQLNSAFTCGSVATELLPRSCLKGHRNAVNIKLKKICKFTCLQRSNDLQYRGVGNLKARVLEHKYLDFTLSLLQVFCQDSSIGWHQLGIRNCWCGLYHSVSQNRVKSGDGEESNRRSTLRYLRSITDANIQCTGVHRTSALVQILKDQVAVSVCSLVTTLLILEDLLFFET